MSVNTVLRSFNTRFMRGSTYPMPRTMRDVNGNPIDLTGAFAYYAMRADIKIAPSVQLTSRSTILASLQLGTLGDGLLSTVIGAKSAPGTAVTIALTGDGVAKAGTIDDSTTDVVLHYQPGVSLGSDMETLLATSTHIAILYAGIDPTLVLDTGSAFAATHLALPPVAMRTGVLINPDQVSFKGQYTTTLIPVDSLSLVALGDDDPWIHELWFVMRDGSVIPDFTVSKIGLYPQAVVLP